MTVQYSLTAATASFVKFFILLFRWKGSVWKLVMTEILIWLFVTGTWLAFYFYAGQESPYFKKSCDKFIITVIEPYDFTTTVTLLIGFTSVLVLSRWLDIYRLLAWPDNFCLMFNSYFIDEAVTSEEARLLRQNIARYLTLSYVLLLKDISNRIRNDFPTEEKLIAHKLVSQEDLDRLHDCGLHEGMCKYWVPLTWIITKVKKHYRPAMKNTSVTDEAPSVMSEQHYCSFVTEIIRIRGLLGDLLSFDWVPIPLAIVQLNVFVCYAAMIHNVFCVSTPFAKDKNVNTQWIGVLVHLLVTCAKLTLYVGWLKCMGVVLNPFGMDDDDFELGYYMKRHSQIIRTLLKDPILTLPDNCYPRMERHLAHTHYSAVNAMTMQPEKHVTVQGSLRRRRQTNKKKENRSSSN